MRISIAAGLILLHAMGFPSAPRVQTFTCYGGQNRIGTTTLVQKDSRHARVGTQFSIRGLAGSTKVSYTFGANGVLTKLDGRAEYSLSSPQTEHFECKNGKATWRSTTESGQAAGPGSSYYIAARTGDPVDLIFLVKALLLSPDHTISLLPSGKARLRTAGKQMIGSHSVDHYEILGLDLNPISIWTDKEGDLLAVARDEPNLIRTGFEQFHDRFWEIQRSRTDEFSRELAKSLLKPSLGPVFIKDVCLFDSEKARMLPHQSVLVEGKTIAAVGPDSELKAPAGSTVIDGSEKYLIPGLWEMHGHLFDGAYSVLAVAAGITTHRDLGHVDRIRDPLARSYESGEMVGPSVIKCLLIDGPGPNSAQMGMKVSTEEEAVSLTRKAAKEGYVQLKLYGSLDPKLVPTFIREAHALGLRVSGHIQTNLSPQTDVEAGYDEINHINFVLSQLIPETWPQHNNSGRMLIPGLNAGNIDLNGPEAVNWLRFLKDRKTVLDPTISLWESLLMDRPGVIPAAMALWWDRLPIQFRRSCLGGGLDASRGKDEKLRASFKVSLEFLRRAHEWGVPIVAGTDSYSGLMLHRDLELLALAGIPANEVLQLATHSSARIMNRAETCGSISPGKVADMVLLDADPTKDISAVRKVIWTLHEGRLMDRENALAAIGMTSN